MIRLPAFLIFASALLTPAFATAGPGPDAQRSVDERGREYFVWAPDTIDPDVTYRLVALAHGNKGTGNKMAGDARRFLARGDVICVAPSYPSPGFQGLELETGEQLLDVIASLRQRYRLHEKVFLHGHSAGAQFSHRFALRYPHVVAGCSAHSAGSAAVGARFDHYFREGARNVPMVLSWGENDTKKAWDGAPYTRVEYGRLFAKEAEDHGLLAVVIIEPGRGHGLGRDGARLRDECFDFVMNIQPSWLELEATITSQLEAGRRPVALVRRALAIADPRTRIGTMARTRFLERIGKLKERCDEAVAAFVESLPADLRAVHDRITSGSVSAGVKDLEKLVEAETAADGPAHQIMADVVAAATAELQAVTRTLDSGDVYAADRALDAWDDDYSRIASLEDAVDKIKTRLSDRDVRQQIRLGAELAGILEKEWRTADLKIRALQRFVDKHASRSPDSLYVKRANAALEQLQDDGSVDGSDDGSDDSADDDE